MIRRLVLYVLRALVWRLDAWIQKQELALRQAPPEPAARPRREFVAECRARELTHRRRGKTAAQFDLALASRRLPLQFSKGGA
jgi:hypothetical protein